MNDGDRLPALLGGTPAFPDGPPRVGFSEDVGDALRRLAADGGWARYEGPESDGLRAELAEAASVRHTRLVAGGTAAVEIALRGVGVGPGDEVVLAAYDFKANLTDVLALGATPVLVDVRRDDAQLDVDAAIDACGPRTKAVLFSHLHGGTVDTATLVPACRRRGVAVVEDACQAPGLWLCRPGHARGDVGVLSFGGSKLLSAGRGGAVLTDDDRVAQRIKLHLDRGNDLSPMSELQAAVLRPQLATFSAAEAERAAGAAQLLDALSDQDTLRPLARSDEPSGLYKLGFWYRTDTISRDLFCRAMRAEGVALDPAFAALHKTHGRSRYRSASGLEIATDAGNALVVLHHPVLTCGPETVAAVADAIGKTLAAADELSALSDSP